MRAANARVYRGIAVLLKRERRFPQNAEAGTEALFGMSSALQDQLA
jgi:hypothetical protein